MIVPSIDLSGGEAVQWIGGVTEAMRCGPPAPIAERFGRVGELAVIDLDAALGRDTNARLVRELCSRHRCRVGGGIRDAATAIAWLEAGARRVILGTAATPEILRELPRDRVQVALDSIEGEVVVKGWRERTGRRLEEDLERLLPFAKSFLLTFVEREGRMAGTDLERVEGLRARFPDAELTIAGGITTADEVARLDALGCDAQVGMALYRGDLPLAEAFAAPLRTDRSDGLWPTVVCDESGVALGLVYSSAESLAAALDEGRGIYQSRKRGLWRKGESSGATQELVAVDLDCDRDCLRFTVRPLEPGHCHRGRWTCFGNGSGSAIGDLERSLRTLAQEPTANSGSARLLSRPERIGAKLREEADELARAETAEENAWEAADLFYFAALQLAARNIPLERAFDELRRRAQRPKPSPTPRPVTSTEVLP